MCQQVDFYIIYSMESLLKLPFKEFPLKQKIGYGSTAVVYVEGSVALKAFAISKIADAPEKMVKLEREIRMNEILNGSPRVPKWYGAYRDDKNVYLAQGFVKGQSLRQIHSSQHQMSEACALHSFIPDMAEFVRDCHANDVAHRDIHLGNFMTEDDRAFGIDLGRSMQFPEDIAFQNDVWSLGVRTVGPF